MGGQPPRRPRPSPGNSNYARYPASRPGLARQDPQQSGQSQHQRSEPELQPQHSAPAKSLTQTATIRNAVNLQKSTLRLVPSQDDPQFLRVAFEFDASEPCCAMTYVAVRERLDGSMKSALAHVASVYKEGTTPTPYQATLGTTVNVSLTFTTVGGGIKGDNLVFTDVAPNVWEVQGTTWVTGTVATPFS